MIVTCESCKTKFELDPARIKGVGSKVRCSRCKHIFYVAKDVDISLDDVALEAQIGERGTPSRGKRSHPSPGRSSTPSAAPRKRSPEVRYLLWSLLVVIIAAGVYWVVPKGLFPSMQATPAGPGKTLPREKEKSVITIMDSMQAYFLENANMGQIFVVEGEIRNDSTKPVSFVLLEGKLYTTDNRVYQGQKAYCGNAMTRDELTRQAVADIQNRMMNREGKDLLNVHIAPQGKVPFQVVFHNLPGLNQLSDYSVAVVSAEID
jgi:predicted Zn finger-like uncharacterized protein